MDTLRINYKRFILVEREAQPDSDLNKPEPDRSRIGIRKEEPDHYPDGIQI